jgi:hypothetical protein
MKHRPMIMSLASKEIRLDEDDSEDELVREYNMFKK